MPLTLVSRRLYILPTSIGLTFAIVCFAMLLGSMNYNNSMGFALTFLLAATGLVAMHRCHQNLAGLRIVDVQCPSVFAGDTTHIALLAENDGHTERLEIRTRSDQGAGAPADIPPQSRGWVRAPLATSQRGVLPIGRLGLNSQFPLNLLKTWSWLYLDAHCLVWPKPASDPPPRPLSPSDDSGQVGGSGDEDFAGLRDYRDGDSPRLIAWKTFARSDEIKAKQFEGSNVATDWVDYDSIQSGSVERRLSILAAWVVEADAAGEQFGLRLPGANIPPGRGRDHRDACLDALARFVGLGR